MQLRGTHFKFWVDSGLLNLKRVPPLSIQTGFEVVKSLAKYNVKGLVAKIEDVSEVPIWAPLFIHGLLMFDFPKLISVQKPVSSGAVLTPQKFRS